MTLTYPCAPKMKYDDDVIIIFLSCHIVKIIMILFVRPIFRQVLLPMKYNLLQVSWWSSSSHFPFGRIFSQTWSGWWNIMMTSCSSLTKAPNIMMTSSRSDKRRSKYHDDQHHHFFFQQDIFQNPIWFTKYDEDVLFYVRQKLISWWSSSSSFFLQTGYFFKPDLVREIWWRCLILCST